MVESTEDIFEAALQLPMQARAELATTLIDSLDDAPPADIESAWREEIAKRVSELDRQAAQTIPWPEIRKKILGDDRSQ